MVDLIPNRSMYAIYAYIDPSNHPNVGIYTIHGASGIGSSLALSKRCFSCFPSRLVMLPLTLHIPSLKPKAAELRWLQST